MTKLLLKLSLLQFLSAFRSILKIDLGGIDLEITKHLKSWINIYCPLIIIEVLSVSTFEN
jgi:hypothetical protein